MKQHEFMQCGTIEIAQRARFLATLPQRGAASSTRAMLSAWYSRSMCERNNSSSRAVHHIYLQVDGLVWVDEFGMYNLFLDPPWKQLRKVSRYTTAGELGACACDQAKTKGATKSCRLSRAFGEIVASDLCANVSTEDLNEQNVPHKNGATPL